MLQRGYIILIAGAALVVAGIALTAVYGSNLASLVLSESIILSDAPINPSATLNRTLQVTNTERTVAIALHVESEAANTQTQQQQASNITMIGEEVRDPGGVVVNKNQFNSRSGNEGNNNNN